MVSHYMLRTHQGKLVFSDKNIPFVTALDVIKCLEQVEQQILRLTCAPLNELPSNISTMLSILFFEHVIKVYLSIFQHNIYIYTYVYK